jgi:hypothetical protein
LTRYGVWFDLEPGPSGKLPADLGLLDAADKPDLSCLVPGAGAWRRLPEGVFCGKFPDGPAALAAFDAALAEASQLLGFPVQARRRLAAKLPD